MSGLSARLDRVEARLGGNPLGPEWTLSNPWPVRERLLARLESWKTDERQDPSRGSETAHEGRVTDEDIHRLLRSKLEEYEATHEWRWVNGECYERRRP